MATEEERKWHERLKDRIKHPETRCDQPWFDWTWKRLPGTPMIGEKPKDEIEMELRSEFETDGDLNKSIPQLVCDFNFEVLKALKIPDKKERNEKIDMELLSLSAQKRMVAMMAQVAIKHEEVSIRTMNLTEELTDLTKKLTKVNYGLIGLTIFIAIVSFLTLLITKHIL